MDYLYTPKFAQPKNLINNDNNYFPLPFKYATKPLKNSNCKEVKQNLKNFYCLTERISLISEQNKLNRISTENTSSSLSNSKTPHEQFNYYKTLNNHNRIMIPHKKCSMQNKNDKNFISLKINNSERQNKIENISDSFYKTNNNQEIKNNNNILRKKNSIIAKCSCCQNNNSKNGSSYNVKNNNEYLVYSNNNQLLTKKKSCFLKKYYNNNNAQTSNNFYTENKSKNKYKEKLSSEFDSQIFGINQKKYDYIVKYKTKPSEENKEYIYDYMKYISSGKNDSNYVRNQNQVINVLYKNKTNSRNFSKYHNSTNNIYINKTNNYKYIEPLNKSQNNILSDNYKTYNTQFINNTLENEKKCKINKVINLYQRNKTKDNILSMNKSGINNMMKNIGLTLTLNSPNTSNDYGSNKNNHSFYESKSLTKNSSNTKINQKYNVIYKTNQNNKKVIKRRPINTDTNNKMLKYKYIKQIKNTTKKVINKLELKSKKDGQQNKVHFLTNNNSFNKKDNNDILSNKEYIYTNDTNYSINNNPYIVQTIHNNKKDKKIALNTNIITNKNKSRNIKTFLRDILINNNSKNVKTSINKDKEKSYSIESNKKTINTREIFRPPVYKEKQKPNKKNIISYRYFSILSTSKEIKKIKKSKKRFNSHKNIIQLKNINNKTYEEDFPIKEKNKLKIQLKPTISSRIVLFGNKEPEDEKYFSVNLFCSENIRNKPEKIDSDFL